MKIALIIAAALIVNWLVRWLGPKMLPPWFRLRYFRPWAWICNQPARIAYFMGNLLDNPLVILIIAALLLGLFIAAPIILVVRLTVSEWWGWPPPFFPTNVVIYALTAIALAIICSRGGPSR